MIKKLPAQPTSPPLTSSSPSHFFLLLAFLLSCALIRPAIAWEEGQTSRPALQGVLLDRADVPVAGAVIYVKSSAANASQVLKTDRHGRYQLMELALGEITVVARDPVTHALSQVHGQLQRPQQQLQLDLQVARADARIEGQVMHQGQPVAGASVSLISRQVFADVGMAQRMTTTDAQGNFVLEKVMPGAMRLFVERDGALAQQDVQTRSGMTQHLQLSLGNSVSLPHVLRGANGNRIEIDWNLALFNGEGSARPAYQVAHALRLNGWVLPGVAAATSLAGGRELRLEALQLDGIDVSRQVWMPAHGAWVRYLEILHNPGEGERVVQLELQSLLGAGERTRILVSPEESLQGFAITGDSEQTMLLGHVFGGMSGSVTGEQSFATDGNVSYRWELRLPAGAKLALLHFALQSPRGDFGQLVTQAQAIANLRQPEMLQGLGIAERAAIRNFKIAP